MSSKDDVMVLLAHLGYLAYDAVTGEVYIPNEEIRQEFFLAVKHSSHAEIANLVKESDKLLQAVLNLNEDAVAAAIEKVHSISTAPIFYNNEQALRSVIRFAFISCMEQFMEEEHSRERNRVCGCGVSAKERFRYACYDSGTEVE